MCAGLIEGAQVLAKGEFYTVTDFGRMGPMPAAEVVEALRDGRIRPEAIVISVDSGKTTSAAKLAAKVSTPVLRRQPGRAPSPARQHKSPPSPQVNGDLRYEVMQLHGQVEQSQRQVDWLIFIIAFMLLGPFAVILLSFSDQRRQFSWPLVLCSVAGVVVFFTILVALVLYVQ